MLRLSLPVPVSVNALYLRTRWGKQIRTKRGREWFAEAEAIIRDEIAKQHWETTDCKVVVEVNTFWRDKRRRDTNNLSKALADALEHGGAYLDDCKALLRYIDYDVDRENPRVDVVVRRFDESSDGWKYGSVKSMDWYAAHLVHLYGTEVDLDYMLMRHEFGVDEFDLNVYEVAELVKDGRFDELPDGFPEKAKDVEIISGPEDMVYIGYSVMMPYEKPKYTQEQMDENIRALLNYLFPKEEVDEISIHTIFATWAE